MNKNEKIILTTAIIIVVILNIHFYTNNARYWWDESTYIGIGRYIATGGEIGFWENFRPPIIPITVSLLEIFGLSASAERFAIATIFTIILFTLQTFIARRTEPKSTTWSLLLLLSAPIILILSTRLLTEIPSTTFILIATIMIFSNKPTISGMMTGIAILTKFPHIAYIPTFIIYIWYDTITQKTKQSITTSIKKSILYTAGIAIILLPYMTFQKIYFGSYTQFMITAQAIPKAITAKIFPTISTYYISYLLETIILIPLFIVGAIYIIKNYKTQKEGIFIITATILMTGYLSTFPSREDRFIAMALPFIAITAGKGFIILREWTAKFNMQKIFTYIIIIILVTTITKGITKTEMSNDNYATQEQEYYKKISEIKTTPEQHIIMAETDALALTRQKIRFLGGIQYAREEIKRLSPNAAVFAWNNCTYLCAKDDANCRTEQEEFNKLLNTMNKTWSTTIEKCALEIYSLR